MGGFTLCLRLYVTPRDAIKLQYETSRESDGADYCPFILRACFSGGFCLLQFMRTGILPVCVWLFCSAQGTTDHFYVGSIFVLDSKLLHWVDLRRSGGVKNKYFMLPNIYDFIHCLCLTVLQNLMPSLAQMWMSASTQNV